MDYNTLVAGESTLGSIKYHINWSRIDSPAILDEAEKFIYARVRTREMTARTDVTISSTATSAALPTRYLDPIALGIPGYIARMRYRDPERFQQRLGWDQDGLLPEAMPSVYSVFNELIQFNSRSDAAYTGKFLFFQRPASLSGSNTTNWLTDRYPTLVRRTCLMYAAEARKDRGLYDSEQIAVLELIDQMKVEQDLNFRGMEMDFNWEEND